MTLRAHLVARRGRLRLNAAFTADRGETVAVLGPSGAGKTTAIRLLAGADALEAGSIVIGEDTFDDPAAGVFTPSPLRRVGWVPQGGGLFAHLPVWANVAFPLRAAGVPRREAQVRAHQWLERFGIADRAAAAPGQLSGGEGRRVAIARALAAEPRLLLLDEPFSGVDVEGKVSVRSAVREAFDAAGAVRLLVVHDPVDALSLADRVVVIEDGSVVQIGTPADLCERPRTPYVAELAGLNLFRGTAATEHGHPVVRSGAGFLQVAEPAEGSVVAVFRPSAVAVFRDPPGGSPRNVLEGPVSELVPTGERVRVRVESQPPVVAELTAEAAAALALRPGERVFAVVKATEIEVSPA